MTEEWDAIATKIHKICTDLEVFISYVHHDRKVAEVLRTLLIEKDYSVWTAEDNLNIGDCWEKQISKACMRAVAICACRKATPSRACSSQLTIC